MTTCVFTLLNRLRYGGRKGRSAERRLLRQRSVYFVHPKLGVVGSFEFRDPYKKRSNRNVARAPEQA